MQKSIITSGLYIVSLNNNEPISVNASDLRIAERCIKVNRNNCKFGRARNLATRKRNYEKTFGIENINFLPVANLVEIDIAEKVVLRQLSQWQVRGQTGRKNEWLQEITVEKVQSIAISTLLQAKIAFVLL